MKLAKRMSRLGTETAFVVLAKAKQLEAQGKDIIHLEIGEPDFDTPQNIIDSAVEALRGGWTHYGPSAGLPEMREAVAEEVTKTRGVKVDPAGVVITPGAKPIMFYAMLALLDDGDEACAGGRDHNNQTEPIEFSPVVDDRPGEKGGHGEP